MARIQPIDVIKGISGKYGRGASLYRKVERELAILRENAKVLRQFEATRASIYYG